MPPHPRLLDVTALCAVSCCGRGPGSVTSVSARAAISRGCRSCRAVSMRWLTSIQRKDAKSASLHSQGSERITGSSWTRTCHISDARIFAAGDAVRFPGPNGLVRQEDWCHAQDAIAGRNGAGANDEYRGADAGPHPDRRRS
jgi:hypothetical protein